MQDDQVLKHPQLSQNCIQDPLLSEKTSSTSNAETSTAKLCYEEQPSIQGQCLLTQIIPVRRTRWRFLIFIAFSALLLGLPALLVYWYPNLKKKWYYLESTLEKAERFYVMNNDGQPTYPLKQEGLHFCKQNESKSVIYFTNRYLKYIIVDNIVKAASLDFLPKLLQNLKFGSNGLTHKEAEELRKSYGVGSMILERKSIGKLFLTQIMRPFYIFIASSCILWSYQNYYYYALIIFVTAAIGIITSLVQTYKLNNKIYEMAYYQTDVNILRNGQIIRCSSKEAVPGDIVFVKDSMKVPFDGILLHGTVLANECSITGQSVPVVKKAQPNIAFIGDIKHSYLYESSIILQVNVKQKFPTRLQVFEKFREEYGLPVYVIRTNFITLKGQLIRIISFPIEKQNIFEKQSVKFLLFLFGVTVISYFILLIRLANNADPLDLFVKFLDLITVTVPAGLPVSMTFGIIFALQKMKEKSIFCTSPNKTIVGGMTNFICFDKTGTLTEDFMDFYALLPCLTGQEQYEQSEPKFTTPILKQTTKTKDLTHIIKQNPHITFALNNMAVNHTLIKLQTTGQNVGDPMEVKMFQFGQFTLKDQDIVNHQVVEQFKSERGHNGEVYRKFQFDTQLFRMSAISRSNITGEDYFIYTKGSPQQMINIFDERTVPTDYFKVLKKYTCQGFRVLAIGHRVLKEEQIKLGRMELEKNLKFNGFEIFQNRLKSQTLDALHQLQNANIPCVMITGDNPLTASSIAFECNIFDPDKKAYICHHSQGDHYILQKFHEHQLEYFEQDQVQKYSKIQQILEFIKKNGFQLCLTGRSFNHIFDNHFDSYQDECKELLKYIKVYARAKPNDKARIISIYQNIGKVVAMCGDGANDCGALKQADIGLSLSQAEASITAPFTSQITNISSMVELLKECRAGLATNFSLFNIMACYSLIQYNVVLIAQFFYGYPADFHWLYWDIFCNFVFFLTFGYTGTAKTLTKEAPNCSLFTISNISQLLIAYFLQMIGQFMMIIGLTYFFADEIGYDPDITYREFLQDGEQFVTDSYESNILFMFSNFMYIFTVLAFSISKPWRKQFYTNILFLILLIAILGFSTVMILVPESRIPWFQLTRLTYKPILVYIAVTAWSFGIFIYALQKYVLEPCCNRIRLRHPDSKYI